MSDKSIKGTVRWFDNLSGEGIVVSEGGEQFFVHWSAIKGKFEAKNGKKSWAELESGWGVAFDVIRDTTFKQVSALKILNKQKPAHMPQYSDRESMKKELTAVRAMFEESWPKREHDYDEFHVLSRKAKRTTKDEKRLAVLQEKETLYRELCVKTRGELTKAECEIYNRYSLRGLTSDVFQL